MFKRWMMIVAALSVSLIGVAPAFAQTAVYNTTAPTLTVKDRADLQADVNGNLKVVVSGAQADANGQVVQPALSSTFWAYAAASGGIVNTTTAVVAKTAAGAGVRNYVLSAQCGHDALGAAPEMVILDGATVVWRQKLQTGAQEAIDINFNPPLRGTANTAVSIQTLTATVTGGVYCNLQGYTGS